jgi:hypothetical protein
LTVDHNRLRGGGPSDNPQDSSVYLGRSIPCLVFWIASVPLKSVESFAFSGHSRAGIMELWCLFVTEKFVVKEGEADD